MKLQSSKEYSSHLWILPIISQDNNENHSDNYSQGIWNQTKEHYWYFINNLKHIQPFVNLMYLLYSYYEAAVVDQIFK